MQSHIGEISALIAAICWTFNSILFESAGKNVGAMSVNYIRLLVAFGHKSALGKIIVGAVLGPFIGVVFSLLAVQYTATGIVSSITSVSPVIIIPFSIMIFKEKVLFREILGAAVSTIGIIILFL